MNKIVIISTLKPCNEVRIYERFALSLAKPNKYEINIIGLAPKKLSEPKQGIRFFLLKNKGRSFKSRFNSITEVYRLLKKIKPKLIILTTPQILLPSIIIKFLFHGKIIYDIQEDYLKNILYQKLYPLPLRYVLAYGIRWFEKMTVPFVDHFFLAEKCYSKSLTFIESKYTILENKFADVSSLPENKNQDKIRLLFTGIISEYSGIHTALEVYKKWKKINPDIRLTVAGYTYQKEIADLLFKLEQTDPNVELFGVDFFIDHELIIQLIKTSTIAFVCHQYNEISKEKIPTKLYEYSYLQLPYFVQSQSNWANTGKKTGGAIEVDFYHIDFQKVEEILKNPRRLFPDDAKELSSWYTQEPKLFKSIKRLIQAK